jgi:hypothetical protein
LKSPNEMSLEVDSDQDDGDDGEEAAEEQAPRPSKKKMGKSSGTYEILLYVCARQRIWLYQLCQ